MREIYSKSTGIKYINLGRTELNPLKEILLEIEWKSSSIVLGTW